MPRPLDQQERSALCDLFAELGPDAPTLCEGWTTADLAAHLVLREHFRRWPDERLATEKAKGFDQLVGRLRGGAPLVPWRVPGLRTLLNGVEYFVHHEDVRRANGLPTRVLDEETDALFWRMAGFLGRRAARRIRPHGLVLVGGEGRRREFGDRPAVTVDGPPPELLLYLSGRTGSAGVEVDGPPDGVAALADGAGI